MATKTKTAGSTQAKTAPSFSNVDEVEFVLGYTFTGNQAIMIMNYIQNGIRPEAGCGVCDSGFIRVVTSEMDQYLEKVQLGVEVWPWSGNTPASSSDSTLEQPLESPQSES